MRINFNLSIAIVILLFLSIAALSTMPIASSGSAAQSDFNQYFNPEFGIKIKYPSSWTETEFDFDPISNPWLVDFTSPRENNKDPYTDFVSVRIDPIDDDIFQVQVNPDMNNSQSDQTVDEELEGSLNILSWEGSLEESYERDYPDFHKISSDLGTLSGRPSYSLIFSYTNNNVDLKIMEVGTIYDGNVYSVRYIAEKSSYSKYLPLAQKMIDSFELVSGDSQEIEAATTAQLPKKGEDNKSTEALIENQNASSEISGSGSNLTSDSVQLNNSNSFSKYENTTYGLSIQYPSEWTIESGNSSPEDEIFSIIGVSPPISSDPDANTFMDIGYDSSVQANDFNLDEYLRGVIESLKTDNEISDFKVESAKTDATLANKPAYSLVTTNTADGTAMKSLEVGTLINDKIYYMLFSTEESKYNSFLPDVQKMIDSFELVSETGASLDENGKTTISNTTERQSENDKTTEANTTDSENLSEGNSNSSFQTYENSKYGIKVQYPSNWNTQEMLGNPEETTDVVQIAHIYAPITNTLSFVVLGYNPYVEGENISLEKYVDDIVKANKKEGFDVESVSTTDTLAGRPAYSLVLTTKDEDNILKSIEVGTLVGNKLYYVLFNAEESEYSRLLPDVEKIIDSYKIWLDGTGVTKTSNITSSSLSSVIANETGGKLLMKLGLEPGLEVDKYQVASEEMSSSNAKICPTDNCQFGFLGKIGGDSEIIQPGLKPNSDTSGYIFEGILKVTINNLEGVSIGSSRYDVQMDLNSVEAENEDEGTTENLTGTMALVDETNPEVKTEYEVIGNLQTEPNIEHEELQGFVVVGPITLNLTAQEK